MWRSCGIIFAIFLTTARTFSHEGYWKPLKVLPVSGWLWMRSWSLVNPSEVIIPVSGSMITEQPPPTWTLSTTPPTLPNLPLVAKIWTTLWMSRIEYTRIVLTVSGQNSDKVSCCTTISSKIRFWFFKVTKSCSRFSFEFTVIIFAPFPKLPLTGLEKKRGCLATKILNSSKVQLRV